MNAEAVKAEGLLLETLATVREVRAQADALGVDWVELIKLVFELLKVIRSLRGA